MPLQLWIVWAVLVVMGVGVVWYEVDRANLDAFMGPVEGGRVHAETFRMPVPPR